MRIHLKLLWLAAVAVLALAVCGARPAAAQADPPTLTVLGAADGQIKILADTARVAATLVIESSSPTPVTVSLRVSPFRDAGGRLHAATVAVGERAKADALSLPPRGSIEARVESTLVAEGEYASEILLVSQRRRERLRLVVTRASRDLSVEIQGLDAVRGRAAVRGRSTAEVRFTLLEKLGRDVTLNPIVLTKLTRKGTGGTLVQTPFRLEVGGGPAGPITLSPNQSSNVVMTIADLAGAGEYAGTVRISAPGGKPVDRDFTLAMRESGGVAFTAILVGVVLSTVMRWLAQTFRPRLVETRRARLLVREVDELLADPARHREESEVLRVLRREALAAELALDLDALTRVRVQLDRLEDRRLLAGEWIVRRRQVEALKPDSLRERFRSVVGGARDVIVAPSATADQIAAARTALSGLSSQIDGALQEELTARIAALRKSLEALVARPMSQLAVAPATLTQLLDEAERQKQGNLRHALAVYDRAHRAWAALLLDDLAAVADGPAPFGLEEPAWSDLAGRMRQALTDARRVLPDDPDAAMGRYNAAWAQYVVSVSDALRRRFEATRRDVEQSTELSDNQRAEAVRALEEAVAANTKAMTEIVAGRTHEAVGSLSRALERAADVQALLTRRTRSEFTADVAAAPPPALEMVPALADGPDGDVVGPGRSLTFTQRKIDAIDVMSHGIAVVVATVLGLTVLWTPTPSWGGWDDWIVAALWGLGLHQFTFAGVAGLTDRLRGGQPAGGQS